MRLIRAAIYARYSSDEQTGGESINYQLEQCREYIANQGWALDEASIFIDEARSGTTTFRREEFNRMVGMVKDRDRPFDVVVAWSTSRFGRDQDEAIFNKIGLRRHGVEVKFVSQPVPDGHIGTLIERIYEWKDEFDSIQIGEYAFQGQKQVTQKGFHGGGKSPFGYRRVRVLDPEGKTDKDGKVVEYTTYEVVPDEAEIVKRIFTEYASGLGYKKITHSLNSERITSPRGGSWDISGIRTIILNENYLGHRVWNQTRRNKKVQRGTKIPKRREEWVITENAHPAIIDTDLWKAVQERRGQISFHISKCNTNHKGVRSKYLLTGLLKCAECGANFTVTTTKKNGVPRKFYRCSHHSNRGKAVCSNGRTVPKDRLEGAVLDLLSEKLLTVDSIEAILEEFRVQAKEAGLAESGRTQGVDRQIRQLDKEMKNLTAAIKAGGPIRDFVAEYKACGARKAELEAERKDLKHSGMAQVGKMGRRKIETAIQDLKKTLSYATPEEQKILLGEHVREIRIPKTGAALLEANPEGLLDSLGCFKMVTPRGVEPPSPE